MSNGPATGTLRPTPPRRSPAAGRRGGARTLALAGTSSEKIQQRVAQIGIEGYAHEASPVVFWDLYGKAGHPVRTTVSEIGPSLLGRILELTDIQAGTLEIAFELADDQGLLLLDLDDLRTLLGFVAENRKQMSAQCGLVSTQSVAAIQRALLSLDQGGEQPCSASPRWSSTTFCARTSAAAASSTSLPPTNSS